MIAVGYCLVMELLVANIPALINQLTARYHLFGTYFAWRSEEQFASDFGQGYLEVYGDPVVSLRLLALAIYTCALLGLAMVVVQRREYLTAGDD